MDGLCGEQKALCVCTGSPGLFKMTSIFVNSHENTLGDSPHDQTQIQTSQRSLTVVHKQLTSTRECSTVFLLSQMNGH